MDDFFNVKQDTGFDDQDEEDQEYIQNLFRASEGANQDQAAASNKRTILGDIEMEGDMYEAKRVSRE